MLNRPEEYKKMSEVESELWWYRILHELVIREIRHECGDSTELSILDAGCGTGGLMISLQKAGYQNLSGFDLSPHAVQFCADKGLNVRNINLKEIGQNYSPASFNVIICNDVLYFLSEPERADFFQKLKGLLKPGGVFISNVPALHAFRGMHDISVGIQKRFTKTSFLASVNTQDYTVRKVFFWPFFLSPIVYITRLIQRLMLSFNKNKAIESDVELPSKPMNQALYWITNFENCLLNWKPFGSSLMVTLKRK